MSFRDMQYNHKIKIYFMFYILNVYKIYSPHHIKIRTVSTFKVLKEIAIIIACFY